MTWAIKKTRNFRPGPCKLRFTVFAQTITFRRRQEPLRFLQHVHVVVVVRFIFVFPCFRHIAVVTKHE